MPLTSLYYKTFIFFHFVHSFLFFKFHFYFFKYRFIVWNHFICSHPHEYFPFYLHVKCLFRYTHPLFTEDISFSKIKNIMKPFLVSHSVILKDDDCFRNKRALRNSRQRSLFGGVVPGYPSRSQYIKCVHTIHLLILHKTLRLLARL